MFFDALRFSLVILSRTRQVSRRLVPVVPERLRPPDLLPAERGRVRGRGGRPHPRLPLLGLLVRPLQGRRQVPHDDGRLIPPRSAKFIHRGPSQTATSPSAIGARTSL